MTEKQLRQSIYGTPKQSAKMVGSGLDRHWEYRGVRITGRRQSGWNAGSVWTSDPIGGMSFEARFKEILMVKIDIALDEEMMDQRGK